MWLYDGKEFTEDMVGDYVGFVYLITNQTNGKQYVGKKLFTKSKTYQRNNKKKRMRVSSDWVSYTGSNDLLNEDIKAGHTISKTILHLCTSKGWCSYHETKEILVRDCLIRDDFYNTWVSAKIRRTHLKNA